jgi:hypothetical protein
MVYQPSFSTEGCACNVFLSLARCFLLLVLFWVKVITLQPLPPLSPYVRSSRETPDNVLSILSTVVGAGAFILPAPLLCAFLSPFWRVSTPPQLQIPDL